MLFGLPEFGFGLLDIGLGFGNTAVRLVHAGLEKCTVEPCQNRASFDVRPIRDNLR